MNKDEKAIYIAGSLVAFVTGIGLFGIGLVIQKGVRRVEIVVNSLPERLVKVIRSNVGL